MRSCQVPIGRIEGSVVTTIEGLSRDRSHPVQQALLAANVGQCGYCIPGMVMAAAALIHKYPDPSEELIRAQITNLCRCGIYPRLVEAIQRAARAARARRRSRRADARHRSGGRRPRRAFAGAGRDARRMTRPPRFFPVADRPVQHPLNADVAEAVL